MIYYILLTIATIITQLTKGSIFQTRCYSTFLLLNMFILMIYAVVTNPITTDMTRYLYVFDNFSLMNWAEASSSVRWEPGFTTYQWVLSKIIPIDVVFIVLSMAIMWAILVFAFKENISLKDIPIIMFGYINLFCFYNLSSNIIRQGFAIVIVLVVIVYLGKEKYKGSLFFWGLAISFHITAVIAFALYIVRKFRISMRTLLCCYWVSCILMLTGLNQKMITKIVLLIGGRVGQLVTRYTKESIIIGYGSVNRFDFLIFTSFWLLVGLWFLRYHLKNDLFYEWILKTYSSFSSIYILFGFIGYSDRIAVYSWYLIPIVLFYPLINMKNKYKPYWIITGVFVAISMFIFFDVIDLYITGLY